MSTDSERVSDEHCALTYRDIAKLAGVSVFSVSCALRNRPGISKERRAHIKAIAKKAGYRPNPLVTALMSQHRRPSAKRQMRAIIVCLMSAQTEKLLGERSSLRERFEGVRSACEEFGFLFEKLRWDDFGESSQRLFAGLRERCVPGVVFQGGDVPEWCLSGWEHYALSSVGNRRINLSCHFASTDDYRNVWTAIGKLAGLGYQRIGFAMAQRHRVVRSDSRSLAAYLAWPSLSAHPHVASLPPYWVDAWDRTGFLQWYKKNRPDVIIAIERTPFEYLKDAGIRIPEDVSFAHLDINTDWRDMAGIYQHNREVGQAAARQVIDQINHNLYGVPEHPHSIQISGTWVDGPSVYSEKPKAKRGK